MKLGYLVPEWPSHTHAFFWQEVEALRAAGIEVHLLSTRKPSEAPCSHAFAAGAMGETHYLFPPHWVGDLAALAARPMRALQAIGYVASLHAPLGKKLKMLGLVACAADLLRYSRAWGLDHLHVHSCANAAHLAAMCSLLGGPPYSLTLHGDLPIYGTDHDKKMARATFVATVTRALQEQVVAKLGIPIERVPVAWMGVKTDLFLPGPECAGVAGQLRLLTISRLQIAKGHAFLLAGIRAAVDRGCDVRCTIAGEGPEKASITAEIDRLGLGQRVKLIGPASHEEVVKLLQEHDAFVLPSVGLGEAAPVAVMEAMSCGLPVICSIIGGTPDMITDGRDGLLVRQMDRDELANAVEYLARDVRARRRLGHAARQRAVACFDYRHTSQRLLDAIRGDARPAPALPVPVRSDNSPVPVRAATANRELVIS